jgi:hypothetical protein
MTITPFEYVTVLISIILGMGMTRLISGLAAIVQRWHNVKIYWPHLLLIPIVFVIQIQDWWATYGMASEKNWSLTTFLFVIIYPVILYLIARLLFPVRWVGKPFDLKEFYFCNYKKIYFFMMLLPIHSIIDNHFIDGYAIHDQLLQIIVFPILLFIVLLNRRDEWIHKITVLLLFAIMVITFFLAQSTLLIMGQ